MDLDVVVHVGVHKNCKIAFSPQPSVFAVDCTLNRAAILDGIFVWLALSPGQIRELRDRGRISPDLKLEHQ